MKKNAFLLALILPLFAIAQKETVGILNIPALELKSEPAKYNGLLPFSKILIIDSRFDTLKVGYAKKAGAHVKLVVTGGLKRSLEATLNASLQSNFDSAKKESLLIVIKHLWLRETNQSNRNKNTAIKYDETDVNFSECIAKLELYLKKDSFFIPLLRIDSTFEYNNRLNSKGSSILLVPFESSLIATEKINWNKVLASGKRISGGEIEAYNNERYQLPILQPFTPKSGIYLTFKDFVQNKIMPCSYTVESESVVDHVYITKEKEKVLITDFWGVCDGKKLFIKAGFKLYELTRQNHTFDFYGNLSVISNAAQQTTSFVTPNGTPITLHTTHSQQRALQKNNKPYQVNMETGAVY